MSRTEGVELIVQVESRDLVRARSGQGAERTGKLDLDELRQDTISVFQSLLVERRNCSRKELEVLGKHLFAVIFNGDTRTLFEDCYRKSEAKKVPLRVQLAFGKGAE